MKEVISLINFQLVLKSVQQEIAKQAKDKVENYCMKERGTSIDRERKNAMSESERKLQRKIKIAIPENKERTVFV